MGKKTIWTVAAGTTAAVLVPGVAYALMAGGSDGPQQAPGIVGGEQRAVQPGEGPEHGAGADAGSLRDAEAELEGSGNAPHQLPAVEQMASAGSGPTVSAVSPLSAVSAASPAPAPQQSSTSKSSSTKQAPAPAQSADTPPSPVSADSPDSPDSPGSPDSPNSPQSPGSAD